MARGDNSRTATQTTRRQSSARSLSVRCGRYSPLPVLIPMLAHSAACAGGAAGDSVSGDSASIAVNYDCEWIADATPVSGPELVLHEESDFPCNLEFEKLAFAFRRSPTAEWPDPRPPYAMDADRVIYSGSSSYPGALLAWNPDGTFKRVVARPGAGPGEIGSPGFLEPFVTPDHELAVRSTGRWSLFSRRLEHQKDIRTPFRGNPYFTTVLGNRRILSTERRGNPAGNWIHILNLDDGSVVSTGAQPVSPVGSIANMEPQGRPVARATDTTFWAGPGQRGEGYRIELRHINGELLRTIRREVSWYPPGTDIPGDSPPSLSGKDAASRPYGGGRPPSTISYLQTDPSGLLFVYLAVINEDWSDSLYVDSELRDSTNYIDRYIEVIDPHRGLVLASSGPHREPSRFANHQFPQTSYAYSFGPEDDDGFPVPAFYRIQLGQREK
jgi:hypothetical protein